MSQAAGPGSPNPPRRGELSVVVVDDDERYRELAAAPFRTRGAYVRTTADGLEALAMCLKEPPDIVLSDVQMPRMDGWQLLRLLRSRPALAAVPVVFLTSLDGEAERLQGYQLGVDGYIPKPYSPDELIARVHQILRRTSHDSSPRLAVSTLRGEVEHVAVSSVLSFLEVEKKTGVLLLVGEHVARLFFSRGRLLRAEVEGAKLTSGDTLGMVLQWSSGHFEFVAQDVQAKDDFGGTPVTALLLEHARRADEKRAR